MKTTGYVRRIDELGRISIPKAVRQQYGINDGDSFELFTDGDYIAWKKVAPNDTGVTEQKERK